MKLYAVTSALFVTFAATALAVGCTPTQGAENLGAQDTAIALAAPAPAPAPTQTAAAPAQPKTARAGFKFRDVPGNSQHAVEGATDAFIEKVYRPGPSYDLRYTSPRGTTTLAGMRNASFPINPIGGARRIPGSTSTVVCSTGTTVLAVTKVSEILTTCAIVAEDGRVSSRTEMPGVWFKSFVDVNGRLEVRTVPRVEYFSQALDRPDCQARQVTASGIATTSSLAYCTQEREPGAACFTSAAKAAPGAAADGHRDARGYCVAN